MNKLNLKLGNLAKKVIVNRTHSVEDLEELICAVFGIRDKVSGATDQNGKFFDLEFINRNLGMFKTHLLSLVVSKDNLDENMSFASDNIELYGKKKSEEFTDEGELFHSAHGFLGYVQDLSAFEEFLLEENKLVIVICSQRDKSTLDLPYNFYLKESQQDSIVIYSGRKKIGELYVKDWKKAESMIDAIVQSLADSNSRSAKDPPVRETGEESLSDNEPKLVDDNGMEADEIKETFLDNLAKLKEEETISELEYYKLKSKLLENPEDFMRKYQMGTRQGFRKHKSIDELRNEIVRSKEQKSREMKGGSREAGFGRNYKTEIPIIVRKYNNVIEKISTSYPLSLQQEQAINLIMELELKGLISESDAREYKPLILQEEPDMYSLFELYFTDDIDQIELAKRLKAKKKKDCKAQQDKRVSEEIIRGIIKYAKRNSFELLRNLALENNWYILRCFEKFEADKNAHNLSTSLEKVACYYRTKLNLKDRLNL